MQISVTGQCLAAMTGLLRCPKRSSGRFHNKKTATDLVTKLAAEVAAIGVDATYMFSQGTRHGEALPTA